MGFPQTKGERNVSVKAGTTPVYGEPLHDQELTLY